MEYKLNKGVGQDVEFCGLKAQYLYLFAGGLLAVFLAGSASLSASYRPRESPWACSA